MDTRLAQLIESSLEFRYYRGNSTETIISKQRNSQPFMVVGQIIGNGLKSHVEGVGAYSLTDGEGYCIPAGSSIRSSHSRAAPALFHWAHVDYFIGNGIHLSQLVQFPRTLTKKYGQKIGRINRQLCTLHNHETQTLARIIERKQLGLELLHILVGDSDKQLHTERLRTFIRMQPILEHMHQHLADPLQAQTLARLCILSFSRFHELFTEATGISPGQYQLRLRLQHAQTQLASSNTSIQEIAESIGYTDNHYFSRIFKKTYGMTPSAYRNIGNTVIV